jgi:hypothetical protein
VFSPFGPFCVLTPLNSAVGALFSAEVDISDPGSVDEGELEKQMSRFKTSAY